MATKRETRHSGDRDASNVFTLVERYEDSISYDLYTWQAGLALTAMFLLLGMGSVVFGW